MGYKDNEMKEHLMQQWAIIIHLEKESAPPLTLIMQRVKGRNMGFIEENGEGDLMHDSPMIC